MARSRKRKASKPVKKYLALWSECDGASQFSAVNDGDGGDYIFSTAEAAQAAIKNGLNVGELPNEGTFAVAEVVSVGKPSGVEWSTKIDLVD